MSKNDLNSACSLTILITHSFQSCRRMHPRAKSSQKKTRKLNSVKKLFKKNLTMSGDESARDGWQLKICVIILLAIF